MRLPKPNSFPRSRTLKRGGIDLVPLSEEHFPYAWAAYRRGSFDESPLFSDDMNVAEFTARLADLAMQMIRNNHEVVIGLTGDIPVLLITVEYSGNLAFPHAAWFPEASSRNKLELILKFFIELKKGHMILTTIKEQKGQKNPDVKFYEHLCKYGVSRRVGTIRDYYGMGANGILFQSVGN